MHDDPILAHVEVMPSRNQGDQSTNIQRSLPMVADVQRLHQEEHSCGNHRDGNDPEGNGDRIVGVEESMVVCHGGKEATAQTARDVNE